MQKVHTKCWKKGDRILLRDQWVKGYTFFDLKQDIMISDVTDIDSSQEMIIPMVNQIHFINMLPTILDIFFEVPLITHIW